MAALFNPESEIPKHVAIIMDGNGRWAKERGLPRREGHRAGAQAVEDALRACGEIGVKYLTLYAFSSENWKRPKTEVKALMGLLTFFLKEKTLTLKENNIQLQVIGRTEKLPASSRRELEKSIKATAGNDGVVLILALNYGSREEIVEAARSLMEKSKSGEMDPAELNPELFAAQLDTADYPDPDLLIRTSGEFRISNFLLWQISYSEIFITKTYWPDFGQSNLEEAIGDYQQRHRRYGGL